MFFIKVLGYGEWSRVCKMLRESETLSPKEYGMMVQGKRKKKRKD